MVDAILLGRQRINRISIYQTLQHKPPVAVETQILRSPVKTNQKTHTDKGKYIIEYYVRISHFGPFMPCLFVHLPPHLFFFYFFVPPACRCFCSFSYLVVHSCFFFCFFLIFGHFSTFFCLLVLLCTSPLICFFVYAFVFYFSVC